MYVGGVVSRLSVRFKTCRLRTTAAGVLMVPPSHGGHPLLHGDRSEPWHRTNRRGREIIRRSVCPEVRRESLLLLIFSITTVSREIVVTVSSEHKVRWRHDVSVRISRMIHILVVLRHRRRRFVCSARREECLSSRHVWRTLGVIRSGLIIARIVAAVPVRLVRITIEARRPSAGERLIPNFEVREIVFRVRWTGHESRWWVSFAAVVSVHHCIT